MFTSCVIWMRSCCFDPTKAAYLSAPTSRVSWAYHCHGAIISQPMVMIRLTSSTSRSEDEALPNSHVNQQKICLKLLGVTLATRARKMAALGRSVGGEGKMHEYLWINVLLMHSSSVESSACSETVSKRGVCCLPAGEKRCRTFCLEKFLDSLREVSPGQPPEWESCAGQLSRLSGRGAVRLTEQVQFRDSLLVASDEATQPNNCGPCCWLFLKKKIDFKEREERGRFVVSVIHACIGWFSYESPTRGLKHNLGLSGWHSDPGDTWPGSVVDSQIFQDFQVHSQGINDQFVIQRFLPSHVLSYCY